MLEVLYATAPDEVYGLELMDLAEIPSGSLYPILARFRDSGWLSFRVEDDDPSTLGRPRRTYYRLTDIGVTAARSNVPLAIPVVPHGARSTYL